MRRSTADPVPLCTDRVVDDRKGSEDLYNIDIFLQSYEGFEGDVR